MLEAHQATVRALSEIYELLEGITEGVDEVSEALTVEGSNCQEVQVLEMVRGLLLKTAGKVRRDGCGK